jgi:hypothetical protein
VFSNEDSAPLNINSIYKDADKKYSGPFGIKTIKNMVQYKSEQEDAFGENYIGPFQFKTLKKIGEK